MQIAAGGQGQGREPGNTNTPTYQPTYLTTELITC